MDDAASLAPAVGWAPGPCARGVPPDGAPACGAGQGDADSDSEDDGKRVVRSHKDKRWDQMTETITKMKNGMKNNDWNAITADYDFLHKLLEKAKQIVAKEGVPAFYFKALLSLDACLQKTLADKPARRRPSPPSQTLAWPPSPCPRTASPRPAPPRPRTLPAPPRPLPR